MSDFFAMGGYAAYLWPSYAIAAALLIGLFIISWRRARKLEAAWQQQRQASPRRRAAARPRLHAPGQDLSGSGAHTSIDARENA